VDPDHFFWNLDLDPHQGNKPDPDPHKKAGFTSGSASKLKVGLASALNKNHDSDPHADPHPHQKC
jgi:hypothetical protein